MDNFPHSSTVNARRHDFKFDKKVHFVHYGQKPKSGKAVGFCRKQEKACILKYMHVSKNGIVINNYTVI